MPELPDLIYIEKHLAGILPGRQIRAVRIKEPIVLRVLVKDAFDKTLTACRFQRVFRHGPFMTFEFEDGKVLIIHPMLAGRFKISTQGGAGGRGLCFTLDLDNGICLQYLDDKRMGKVYLTDAEDNALIPRYATQGVDILGREFTPDLLKRLIQKKRNQVRVFLMDQTVLSAIGNAYADEILFHAGLHPKTLCNQLDKPAVAQLYQSIIEVMKWGISEVTRAGQPIEKKVRDHMQVRNRKGQPCHRCGDTIRSAGVLGHDAFFCPTCQPPQRRQFIQW